MTRSSLQLAALAASLLALSACASRPRTPVASAAVPPPRPYTLSGLEAVIGATATSLVGQFGRPDLDLREGPGRKLQFLGQVCVLDAYLYPGRGGGEAVVTHVDARLPDGREMDRSSCVAALQAQRRSR